MPVAVAGAMAAADLPTPATEEASLTGKPACLPFPASQTAQREQRRSDLRLLLAHEAVKSLATAGRKSAELASDSKRRLGPGTSL